MLNCEIKELVLDFDIPTELKDVTVQQYVTYLDTVPEPPQNFIQWLNKEVVRGQPVELELATFLPYATQYLHFWTKVSISDLMKVDANDIINFYFHIETALAAKIPDEDYTYPEFIEHAGEKFYLPERYLANTSTGDFLEAMNVEHIVSQEQKTQLHSINKVCAVLLKKYGEIGTSLPDTVLSQREKLFLSLTLDKAYIIVFFFVRQSIKLATSILTCSEQEKGARIVPKLPQTLVGSQPLTN